MLERGVLSSYAPGILKNSKTFPKIQKFFVNKHIHVLNIRAKFHDEVTFFVLCAKKNKTSVFKNVF